LKPDRQPSAFEREVLYKNYGTPSEVRAHCLAVADKALSLAAQIIGCPVDLNLLRAACELHDIIKPGSDHAARSAAIFDREGYPDVSALIAAHQDLPPDAGIEAQLLYLADKLVIGTRSVSLEERFDASMEKCRADGALESWRRRLRDAQAIIERYRLII